MPYDVISAALQSYIGRIVAFVLTPILLPAVGAISVWMQNSIGIDLPVEAVVGYTISTTIGVALVIYKWLENRGRFEIAAAQVVKLHDEGAIKPGLNA